VYIYNIYTYIYIPIYTYIHIHTNMYTYIQGMRRRSLGFRGGGLKMDALENVGKVRIECESVFVLLV
jgi:hypothetical protein